MASFTGLKNLGEKTLEYMMRHRPTPDLEMSAGLHDLDNLFPGIYGRHASDYKTYSSDPKVDIEAMEAINAVRGNPEAMVDIYRAVPKGVRDFNTGDWVTTSKAYAKGHGESALKGEYDLIKAKARAADISSPGDSIAEQGYWGMPVKGMITKGLLPLVGGGAVALAMSPDEAEAAVRPDILDVIKKAVGGSSFRGAFTGTLESKQAREALERSPKYRGSKGFTTDHSLTNRYRKDGWTEEQIAAMYHNLYDLPDTVVIPNVLGYDPAAQEALWNPLYGGKSVYMPIVPKKKKGFTEITIYDPDASHVGNLLKQKGYWEGGSTSSIFTPSLDGPVQPVGSGPISAVNNPFAGKKISELTRKSKGLIPGAVTGTGAALYPSEAEGVLPADPTQYGGLMGYVARDGKPAGNPIQNELVAAAQNQGWGAPVSWGDVRHGLSYGSRAVLEGLGSLAEMGPNAIANAAIAPFTDYRFGNPGAAAADAMGLDRPWNNAERMVYGLNKGASETVPLVATGQALARGGAGLAEKFGKFIADSPRAQAIFGGMMGLLGGAE